MVKIGLITIIDYKNYGNRLQNYAVEQVLKSLGCIVITLVNHPYKGSARNNNIIEKLKGKSLIGMVQGFTNLIRRIRYQGAYNKKENALREFTKLNINESNFILTTDSIPKNIGDNFDYFVVGSDQVWNPFFRKGSPIDFLTFAPQNKRIAYAPSFGISDIPYEYKNDYKKWLSEFSYLSVREDTGAKIIKNMTDRDAQVLVDPTLMLSREKWLNISNPSPLKPYKPFITTYFLGGFPVRAKKIIRSLSRIKDLEVVTLGSHKQIERYATSPSEFLDYINSSNIILTDSFHGVAFSILMEKPFVVFDRIGNALDMSSRIDTILNKFDLMNRKIENINGLGQLFQVDYTHVKPILNKERKNSIDYLKKALNIN